MSTELMERCPACGAQRATPVRRSDYPHRLFVISRPLQCSACGAVFDRRHHWALCLAVALVGAVILCIALTQDVVPKLSMALHEPASVRPSLFVGIAGAIGGAWIATVGLRAAVHSLRLSRKKHDAENKC